ncbi:MAG: lipoyl synthase [Candidatus Marinimicrobia bacterium]|nr:lipoyl synthase [Candidatus Neomarinimicrobiota bacterium]
MLAQVPIKKRTRPDWLKIKLTTSGKFLETQKLIRENSLNTVCEEARCPNIYECWGRQTATIMILGDTCTRSCGFCSVKTEKPLAIDTLEPTRTGKTVKAMNLQHVVITSVDRDDLKNDYGAEIWAETIQQIRIQAPECTIEVLTPDFRNYAPAYEKVFDAKPDIFSHNVECVRRISKAVRPQSDWNRSLSILKASVEWGLKTKTGMMVGLGETDSEVLETMGESADLGISIFNIGQYLQPTFDHLPVQRYVHPDTFELFKEKGLKMGFAVVESGPLVRSSYHADEQVKQLEVIIN